MERCGPGAGVCASQAQNTAKKARREKLLVVFCAESLPIRTMSCFCRGSKHGRTEQGFGLFVCNTQRDLHMEERYLKMMWQLKPLGIIYTCNPSHCFMELVEDIVEDRFRLQSSITRMNGSM